MYVTTFYSFKGGVGRTMALVNVAVELAQRGRRVLAVDFDLEAPGLDTFDLPRPPGLIPGMVDFVSEYLDSGQAPDASEFVFKSRGIGSESGGLWIMPSGAHLDSYASTFAKIDWGELYERHDGYLLFEDLKEQWKSSVKPDYVLVDSRTGHTDVGGICTRQLPDAVAILFFPNTQNLRGLTKVVRDIRSARTEPGNQQIRLHFIMSNVPDLDDEDRILEESIASFEKDLVFRGPQIIHRYDSLSLLNQVIFTKDRPRSRLAKEYHAVTAGIMRHNPLDRDGVLDFLDSVAPMRRYPRSLGLPIRQRMEIGKYLETVEGSHQNDGEVLFRIGSLRNKSGRFKEAVELFDRAIEAGYREPEVYLSRAHIRRRELDDEGARRDAADVIDSSMASADQVLEALGIVGSENLKSVASSPALVAKPPEERVWIAQQLNTSTSEAKVAIGLLRPLLADAELPTDMVSQARHLLVLSSIAVGRFSDAVEAILNEDPDVSAMRITHAFNYGMALWGESGQITREPFERVLERNRIEPMEPPTPNYLQCMAIAHWAVGETNAARELAIGATRKIQSRRGQEFSCWRYLRVPKSEFEQDVDELLRLIGGEENVEPRIRFPSERFLPGVAELLS